MNLTSEAIKYIAASCITDLDVSDCTNLINAIADGVSSLTVLTLGWCENLTDDGIMAIATKCTSLTILNVAYNNHLTYHGIQAVTDHFHRLKIII